MHLLHTAHASARKFEPGCIYCRKEKQERDRKARRWAAVIPLDAIRARTVGGEGRLSPDDIAYLLRVAEAAEALDEVVKDGLFTTDDDDKFIRWHEAWNTLRAALKGKR